MRNPLQIARTAKTWLAAHVHMWKFGNHGRRRFRHDPRYDLKSVTRGFMSHIDDASDDTDLLDRICTAYNKAVERRQSEGPESPSRLRPIHSSPVINALLARDTVALGRMYRNFYRDPCSSGLLRPPYGMSKAYFGSHIKNIYRHFYLSHVLYRLDYWKELTENRFSLKDLSGPAVGNPFGVTIDGVHISVGSEYAHYCAQRAVCQIDRDTSRMATIAEIGGGFGGTAYYLLRDGQPLRYFDFDAPENIALCSYYLMKAFPKLRFLLYGEEQLTAETIPRADVVLMPMFALQDMSPESVDATFSSQAMSNLPSDAMAEVLQNALRMTSDALLCIANGANGERIAALVRAAHDDFTLTDRRVSGWHSFKVSGAGVGGAAGLAASMSFEQCFTRSVVLQKERAHGELSHVNSN